MHSCRFKKLLGMQSCDQENAFSKGKLGWKCHCPGAFVTGDAFGVNVDNKHNVKPGISAQYSQLCGCQFQKC